MRVLNRSRRNGFDYDVTQNRLIIYGNQDTQTDRVMGELSLLVAAAVYDRGLPEWAVVQQGRGSLYRRLTRSITAVSWRERMRLTSAR